MAGVARSLKAGLTGLALLGWAQASADCLADLRGEVYCGAGACGIDKEGLVWCSRHLHGGVAVTLQGRVLCGAGACAIDSRGGAFCSSEMGGSVMIDSRGRVRCYGGCEPASVAECENTPADTAGG